MVLFNFSKMETLSSVQSHYHRDGLYEAIISILQQQGHDLNNITRNNIAGADEFHVRGAAVSKELATMIDLHGLGCWMWVVVLAAPEGCLQKRLIAM